MLDQLKSIPTLANVPDHQLEWLNEQKTTLYTPYGTSLRMSDLGYQNDAQAGLKVSYNSLDEYVSTLTHAIRTPNPAYEAMGIQENGEYKQLNANILQIENEYYGSIRPKQIAQSGERPTVALAQRGVEYIEMRCVDLDPYLPIGIGETQMRFLEVFALFCLLENSPAISDTEQNCIDFNREAIVLNGRNPALVLKCGENEIPFRQWADNVLANIANTATLFDKAHNTSAYSESVAQQIEKVHHPEKTLSAKIIQDIRDNEQTFYHFAMRKAVEHESYFKARPLEGDLLASLQQQSEASIQQQKSIEDSDELPLEEFLAEYFA